MFKNGVCLPRFTLLEAKDSKAPVDGGLTREKEPGSLHHLEE